VSDQIQRDLAADLAKSVEGVRSVNNQITIVEAYAPPTAPRNWRQKINDMNTAASIKRRLVSQGELRGLKIGVNVERAAVTLFGVVGTEAQRDHIAQIAMDTEGVARVENNLTVRAKEPLDQVQNVGRQVGDEWTEKRVETALAFNSHIQVRDLNVEVDDGICILTGLVDTAAQRDLASSIAEHIYSVGEVRNEIRVRDGAESAPPPPPASATPPAQVSPTEPPLEFLEAE
jgi:osmotically-inducible protein OsmY